MNVSECQQSLIGEEQTTDLVGLSKLIGERTSFIRLMDHESRVGARVATVEVGMDLNAVAGETLTLELLLDVLAERGKSFT